MVGAAAGYERHAGVRRGPELHHRLRTRELTKVLDGTYRRAPWSTPALATHRSGGQSTPSQRIGPSGCGRMTCGAGAVLGCPPGAMESPDGIVGSVAVTAVVKMSVELAGQP